jgi:hypothetical protein
MINNITPKISYTNTSFKSKVNSQKANFTGVDLLGTQPKSKKLTFGMVNPWQYAAETFVPDIKRWRMGFQEEGKEAASFFREILAWPAQK